MRLSAGLAGGGEDFVDFVVRDRRAAFVSGRGGRGESRVARDLGARRISYCVCEVKP